MSGRMLWPLAIVTVGEHYDKSAPLEPFLFTTADVLINDALGHVCKVSELCFPQYKLVGRSKRVSEFIPEDSVFAEGGVAHSEHGLLVDSFTLLLRYIIQGYICGLIYLIMYDGMSLRESSTLHVLPGKPHVDTLG